MARIAVLILLAALPMTLSADVTPHFGRTGPVIIACMSSSDVGGAPRMTEMGAVVKWLDRQNFVTLLKEADVLFLPSCWAVDATENGPRALLTEQKAAVEKFLKAGRGIFVSQPNIDGVIDVLPLKFEVRNSYSSTDEIAVIEPGPLTEGLESTELPYPSDQVVEHDPAFKVITQGTSSKSPSLMLATWGGGRIVVNTDNDSIRDRMKASVTTSHTSDRALQRQLEWLARRVIRPAKTKAK